VAHGEILIAGLSASMKAAWLDGAAYRSCLGRFEVLRGV
jgi:hypothetical protein